MVAAILLYQKEFSFPRIIAVSLIEPPDNPGVFIYNQIPGLDPKFDKNRKGTYRIYESTILELSFDDGEKKFLTLEPGGNLYGNMPYYDSEKGWYEYIQYWEKTAGTDSSIAVHFTKCNA